MVRNKNADEKYKKLLRMYERIFICLVGHENIEARDDAIRLLNVIYDRLDWQFYNPHVSVIKYIHLF